MSNLEKIAIPLANCNKKGFKMPLQIHLSSPRAVRLRVSGKQFAISNIGLFSKPRGGLWTSSYIPEYTCSWAKWCIDEKFSMGKSKVFGLTVKESANVYVIDTLADLKALHKRFPAPTLMQTLQKLMPAPNPGLAKINASMDFQSLDWEKIATQYDGVHLTEAGQWRTRLTKPLNLYGWDLESTLWFRFAFEKDPIDLGVVNLKELAKPLEDAELAGI